MESAKNSLERIVTSVTNLTHLEKTASDAAMTEEEKNILEVNKGYLQEVEDAMDDDLTQQTAIISSIELVKLANSNIS